MSEVNGYIGFNIAFKPIPSIPVEGQDILSKGLPVLTRLFILFTIVPIIEVYLIIKAGQIIGPLPTVLLLLAISSAGAWLVRAQGFQTMRSIRSELAEGRLPAAQLMDGAMVLVGGVLLLTPGFFTDLLGLFFLIPITRAQIMRLAGYWLRQRINRGTIVVRHF
jgi:UPF0716 protein FxsA